MPSGGPANASPVPSASTPVRGASVCGGRALARVPAGVLCLAAPQRASCQLGAVPRRDERALRRGPFSIISAGQGGNSCPDRRGRARRRSGAQHQPGRPRSSRGVPAAHCCSWRPSTRRPEVLKELTGLVAAISNGDRADAYANAVRAIQQRLQCTVLQKPMRAASSLSRSQRGTE
jgi:hypothetical protein